MIPPVLALNMKKEKNAINSDEVLYQNSRNDQVEVTHNSPKNNKLLPTPYNNFVRVKYSRRRLNDLMLKLGT